MRTFFSLLAAIAALSAQAATFTVDNNADSGAGSLRQAIADANVSPGPNIITFDTNLNGTTILLTSGELAVSNGVSIVGRGPDQLAIDGNGSNRVFYFLPGQTNLIAGLTITNGNAGSGPGGGIYNDRAVLTVSNITLSGNSADTGGGIMNDGNNGSATLTILNCTLNRNASIHGSGGGIYNKGSFGIATLTIQNSTLSSNFAINGGGIANAGSSGLATLTIRNSTLSGNLGSFGGGIYNGGSGIVGGIAILNITHTLLAHGSYGANFVNSGGSVTNLGSNLSDDGSMTSFATTVTNLFLGPLTNNGGPTLTHVLLAGSPAINAGNPSFTGLAFDQRGEGFHRVSGSAPDIGAVELQMTATTTPSVLTGLTVLGNGSFQFGFTNVTGASFTVFGSTNAMWPLDAWANLGPAVEIPPASGQYQFTDPQATNSGQHFYCVRSP